MNTPQTPRPTIREVARACKVSLCTVSLVLSDKPAAQRISERTRQRVREAARQLGYKANPLGRDLQRGYTNQLLLIIVSWNLATSHAATAMAISRVAARKNLLLTVHVADDDQAAEEFVTRQNLHNLEGVFVLWDSPAFEKSALLKLANDGIPVVDLLPGSVKGISVVTIDREEAGFLATRHLLQLGHECIGFIGDSTNRPSTTLRKLAGYRRALSSAGLDPNSEWLAEVTEYGFSGGLLGFRELNERCPNLTAVFCINDAMALGAMEAAREAGKSTPEEFAAIGFGDSVEGKYWSPKLTTFPLGCDEVAERAVTLVSEHRRGHLSGPRTFLLPASLLIRESTAARRGVPPALPAAMLVKKSRRMARTSIVRPGLGT